MNILQQSVIKAAAFQRIKGIEAVTGGTGKTALITVGKLTGIITVPITAGAQGKAALTGKVTALIKEKVIIIIRQAETILLRTAAGIVKNKHRKFIFLTSK